MRHEIRLMTGTAIALTLFGGAADHAQARQRAETTPTTDLQTNVEDDDKAAADIIVVGIRRSIEDAVAKKRKSSQVVDSVVAEDAGKLPDNNVVEAVSRIPGVNITRGQGQGGSVTIRGLAGVQTTVNGNDVAVGDGRALSLSDIPAELIKSVDVYKSRGADAPEGGIGGSVDIELRRPLDLKPGLTVAGSARGFYNELVKEITPYVSGLVGYSFETGMGDMGFLINASYTRTKYNEPLILSESPDRFFGPAYDALPANIRDRARAPFRISYGENSGERTQPAVTTTYQWRLNEHLDFVVEGQYFGSRFRDRYNNQFLLTRLDGIIPSNVVLGESGAIQSYTLTNPYVTNGDGVVVGGVIGGTEAGETRGNSDTYIGNFETHWRGGIARIDFSGQYQALRSKDFFVGYGGRYRNAAQANVDFNSSDIPGGAPLFTFPGVDPTSSAQSLAQQFTDRRGSFRSDLYVYDLKTFLDFDPKNFIRVFEVGARLSKRNDVRSYGYRTAEWIDAGLMPAANRLGIDFQTNNPALGGSADRRWTGLNPTQLYDNWDAVRRQLVTLNPQRLSGPGAENDAAQFLSAAGPDGDRGQEGRFYENIFAAYAQIAWGFDMGFPVEGLAGVRYVNTWGGNVSTVYDVNTFRDANGDMVCCRVNLVDDSVRSNFVDMLPSASAVWHFTPKLQLRTTYNYNVQRPSFYALRNFVVVEQQNPNAPVFAGNPDLRPTTDHNFNAILEWYPRGGTFASFGAFYKKQNGFIYPTGQIEPVAQLGGALRTVFKERNAGPGEVQGFEFNTSTNFFFLPRVLQSFGVSLNATYIPTATLSVPDITGEIFTDTRSPFTSEWTGNAILFYDTPSFSARLAYNRRSSYKVNIDAINPGFVQIGLPNERLDAAINYTPVRFLTLSLEGTNLTKWVDRNRYDLYPDLPAGFRQMGRTVQASVRVRF